MKHKTEREKKNKTKEEAVREGEEKLGGGQFM